MMADTLPDTATIDFLSQLYAGIEKGWLSLFALDRTTGNQIVDWAKVDDLGTLATRAQLLSTRCCVWWGVATRTEHLPQGRGGAADCDAIPALWVDIDVAGPAHKAADLPPTTAAASELLRDFPLQATVVVDSGNGIQAWWALEEPLAARDAEMLLARWGTTWAELARRRGYHIDNTFDLARVMRLPGTVNRKPDTPPKLVTILTEDWALRYSATDLDEYTIEAQAPPEPVEARRIPYIGPERPGDAFNATADPGSLLERAGFHFDHTQRDGTRHYRAPHRVSPRESTGATVYTDGHTTIWSETFARAAGMQVRRPYDAFGLYAHLFHRGDWRSAAEELEQQGYGSRAVVDLNWIPETVEVDDPGEPWGDVIPLSEVRDLPRFPLHVLPDWIADQVDNVASELQMPVDLPAQLALAALATIAAKRINVRVRGSWVEPVNLYLVTAMPPGAGKSPAYRQMLGPLDDYERSLTEQMREKIAEAELHDRMLDKKIKKAEDTGDADEALRLLRERLKIKIPKSPRVATDDSTPEALVLKLSEQDGRLAILSTEGGVFDDMAGRYVDDSNLDPYLKAWGGDTIRVDRIGRDSIVIHDPALTIGITVQPSVITALAQRQGFDGRGLTSRFMYSVPPDFVGRRDMSRETISNLEVRQRYREHLLWLAGELSRFEIPSELVLAPEAVKRFNGWRQALEGRRREGDDLEHMRAWTTKCESSVIRFAGLLHLARGHGLTGEVDEQTVTAAIEVGDYWLQHAMAVHEMWGADPLHAAALAIVAWIERAGRGEFSVRDVYHDMRKRFPTADDTKAPLELLTERGYIRPLFDGPIVTGKRGVPSPRFASHPSLSSFRNNHVADEADALRDSYCSTSSSQEESEESRGGAHGRHGPHDMSEPIEAVEQSITADGDEIDPSRIF